MKTEAKPLPQPDQERCTQPQQKGIPCSPAGPRPTAHGVKEPEKPSEPGGREHRVRALGDQESEYSVDVGSRVGTMYGRNVKAENNAE